MTLSKFIDALQTVLDTYGDAPILSLYNEENYTMIVDTFTVDSITLTDSETGEKINAYCILPPSNSPVEEPPKPRLRLIDTSEEGENNGNPV